MWDGLREDLQAADLAATRLVEHRWALSALVHGAALGSGAWGLLHPARLDALARNVITAAETQAAVRWAGAGAALVLAVHVVAARIARRGAGGSGSSPVVSTRDVAARLGPWITPCLAMPLCALLRQPGIEARRPALTLLFAVLVAAAFGRAFHAALAVHAPALSPRSARIAAALGVGVLSVGYGVHFSWLSVQNHRALHTGTADLGYYVNTFYQSIHGHPLGCSYFVTGTHADAHFDPILVVLSPLYALYPRADLLLVLQSFLLGAGVVPVYLLARARGLGRDVGISVALAYAFYPALHGANLYDFHSLSLFPTAALWLLYCAETGRRRAYGVALALTLLCREDVALVLCPVGLYFLLDGRRDKARLGWATVIVAVLYFTAVKRYFMTSSAILNTGPESRSYEHYYSDLIPHGDGARGLVLSLVANPGFALAHAVTEPKLMFVALLFAPLLFLPLFARPERVTLAYGLLFCTLASREPLFQIHFQYTSLITPFAFLAAIGALAAIAAGKAPLGGDGARLSRALAMTSAAATVLAAVKFGGVAENESFRAGPRPVTRVLDADQAATYAWVEETAASIPKEASVAVTNSLGAHVSSRPAVFFYQTRDDTDYVFADDREIPAAIAGKHQALVAGGALVEVTRHGTMALYRARR